jgi:long-chain acyl-CoA synthetase
MAMDLAAMAEGLIVVPLYSRQAPAELVAMIKDSTPSLVCCGDAMLRDGIQQNWTQASSQAPQYFLFDEIFAGVEGIALDRPQVQDADPVTIIYTSGTSGEAKGVVLTAANVGFMLGCTSARLDRQVDGRAVWAGSSFPLSAVQLLRVMDRIADFSFARKPRHLEHRLDEESPATCRPRLRTIF